MYQRGRAGERESGRAGERESGRAGERETRQKGISLPPKVEELASL